MLLEGKKALITGSRRGIGRGIADLFAIHGADIGINDVESGEDAEQTVNMVKRHGRAASWHKADIANSSDVNRMFEDFIEEHGTIDITFYL